MSELLLELKPSCISCPQQAETQRDLLMFSIVKRFFTVGGEHMVGESGKIFDEFVASQVPEEDVDEIKQSLRKFVGNSLEDVDKQIDEIRAMSKELGDSCNGILKMRASKDGVCYKVGVCTSSLLRQSHENHIDGNALTANILATPDNK